MGRRFSGSLSTLTSSFIHPKKRNPSSNGDRCIRKKGDRCPVRLHQHPSQTHLWIDRRARKINPKRFLGKRWFIRRTHVCTVQHESVQIHAGGLVRLANFSCSRFLSFSSSAETPFLRAVNSAAARTAKPMASPPPTLTAASILEERDRTELCLIDGTASL